MRGGAVVPGGRRARDKGSFRRRIVIPFGARTCDETRPLRRASGLAARRLPAHCRDRARADRLLEEAQDSCSPAARGQHPGQGQDGHAGSARGDALPHDRRRAGHGLRLFAAEAAEERATRAGHPAVPSRRLGSRQRQARFRRCPPLRRAGLRRHRDRIPPRRCDAFAGRGLRGRVRGLRLGAHACCRPARRSQACRRLRRLGRRPARRGDRHGRVSRFDRRSRVDASRPDAAGLARARHRARPVCATAQGPRTRGRLFAAPARRRRHAADPDRRRQRRRAHAPRPCPRLLRPAARGARGLPARPVRRRRPPAHARPQGPGGRHRSRPAHARPSREHQRTFLASHQFNPVPPRPKPEHHPANPEATRP